MEHLLNCCRSRIPWPVMRNILRSQNLPVSKGWDATIKSLLAHKELGDKEAKEINALEDYYFEHLLTGERAVRLFDIENEAIDALTNAIKGFVPRETVYNETYPFP